MESIVSLRDEICVSSFFHYKIHSESEAQLSHYYIKPAVLLLLENRTCLGLDPWLNKCWWQKKNYAATAGFRSRGIWLEPEPSLLPGSEAGPEAGAGAGAGAGFRNKFPEPDPPQNRPAPKPWRQECWTISWWSSSTVSVYLGIDEPN